MSVLSLLEAHTKTAPSCSRSFFILYSGVCFFCCCCCTYHKNTTKPKHNILLLKIQWTEQYIGTISKSANKYYFLCAILQEVSDSKDNFSHFLHQKYTFIREIMTRKNYTNIFNHYNFSIKFIALIVIFSWYIYVWLCEYLWNISQIWFLILYSSNFRI